MTGGMGVRLHLPSHLCRLWGAPRTLDLDVAGIADLVADLDRRFPGARRQLCEPGGAFRPFVLVFVNGRRVEHPGRGDGVPLGDGDEVRIIPAVAGGRAGAGSPVIPT